MEILGNVCCCLQALVESRETRGDLEEQIVHIRVHWIGSAGSLAAAVAGSVAAAVQVSGANGGTRGIERANELGVNGKIAQRIKQSPKVQIDQTVW